MNQLIDLLTHENVLLQFEYYINDQMLNECCNLNCLVALINDITVNAVTGARAFRNGNSHISPSVRRKSFSSSAFESSRRALQLASHCHRRNTSYFTQK